MEEKLLSETILSRAECNGSPNETVSSVHCSAEASDDYDINLCWKSDCYACVRQKIRCLLHDPLPCVTNNPRYAITININSHYTIPLSENTYVYWRDYEDQQDFLSQIFTSECTENKFSIIKVVYEYATKWKICHLHAIVEYIGDSCIDSSLLRFEREIEKWYGYPTTGKRPYRTIKIEPIHNEEGWVEYMNKDIKKN